jgi:beta-glucosidase
LVNHLITAHKTDESRIDELAAHISTRCQKHTRANEEVVYAKDKKEATRWDAKNSDSALVPRIATEGMVLLKNEGGILPIRKGKVAVIGPTAKAR